MKKALWVIALASGMCGLSGNVSAAVYTLSATDDDTICRANTWTTNYNSSSTTLTVARAWGIISKSYIKFSSSDIDSAVSDASLSVTLVNNWLGGTATIQVYALNDGVSGETTWTETSLTYSNAPQNLTDNATALGSGATLIDTITVTGTAPAGTVYTISGSALVNFLNSDTNRTATFVLVSGTNMLTTSSNQAQFASSENTTYAGPTLTVTTVPEPASVLALGSGGLLLMSAFRRKN